MISVLRAWWRVLIAVRSSVGSESVVGDAIAAGSAIVGVLPG